MPRLTVGTNLNDGQCPALNVWNDFLPKRGPLIFGGQECIDEVKRGRGFIEPSLAQTDFVVNE